MEKWNGRIKDFKLVGRSRHMIEREKEDDRICEGIPGFSFRIKSSICCDKRERESPDPLSR